MRTGHFDRDESFFDDVPLGAAALSGYSVEYFDLIEIEVGDVPMSALKAHFRSEAHLVN